MFLILLFAGNLSMAQQLETLFNEPGFTGQSTLTIEDKIIDLSRQAVPGSTLKAALYQMDRAPVADALVEASKRGVKVDLVMDGGNLKYAKIPGHAINKLIEGLQCQPGDDCLHFCKGPISGVIKLAGISTKYPLGKGCRGIVINHNKLFLFSELQDGTKNMVLQTSANMMDDMLIMYNDLIMVKNDKSFFDGFNEYFAALKTDHTILFKKSFRDLISQDQKIKAYFFPRTFGADPILQIFKRVNCKLPGSSIRIFQAAFNRHKIAERLKQLEAEGCSLEVITRKDPEEFSPGKRMEDILGSSMIVLPYQGKTPEENSVNSTHTKIGIIDASMDNSPEKIKTVITGSHNWDLFSLKTNDETVLEIRDPEIYDQYNDFISRALATARAENVHIFTYTP